MRVLEIGRMCVPLMLRKKELFVTFPGKESS
jgi:hypothetical protein